MADCTFCAVVSGDVRAAIVLDEPDVVAFLDRRPVFEGHTLVVPRAHVVTLLDLPEPLVPVLFGSVRRVAAAVQDGLGADGSFVAVNNTVSQSVAHLHVHVVPRRFRDGLRGFFWPRHRYPSDERMAEVAGAVRGALIHAG